MSDDDDHWTRPTRPNGVRQSLEYRHGLLLRDVAWLKQQVSDLHARLDHLEGFNRSMHPRTPRIQAATVSTAVSAAVSAIAYAISLILR